MGIVSGNTSPSAGDSRGVHSKASKGSFLAALAGGICFNNHGTAPADIGKGIRKCKATVLFPPGLTGFRVHAGPEAPPGCRHAGRGGIGRIRSSLLVLSLA